MIAELFSVVRYLCLLDVKVRTVGIWAAFVSTWAVRSTNPDIM